MFKRANITIDGKQYGGHWMLTFGTERAGIRVTRGSLSRHGKWHPWWPCVFPLWRGRRVSRENIGAKLGLDWAGH